MANVKILFAEKWKTISLENQKNNEMAKKIRTLLVILFLLQINFSVFANSLYKAVVKDSATNQNLQGVIILVNNVATTSTNNNGFFFD